MTELVICSDYVQCRSSTCSSRRRPLLLRSVFFWGVSGVGGYSLCSSDTSLGWFHTCQHICLFWCRSNAKTGALTRRSSCACLCLCAHLHYVICSQSSNLVCRTRINLRTILPQCSNSSRQLLTGCFALVLLTCFSNCHRQRECS